MNKPYTVALEFEPSLPFLDRIDAEIRSATALERFLGTESDVVHTYRSWVAVSESQADELDRAPLRI